MYLLQLTKAHVQSQTKACTSMGCALRKVFIFLNIVYLLILYNIYIEREIAFEELAHKT